MLSLNNRQQCTTDALHILGNHSLEEDGGRLVLSLDFTILIEYSDCFLLDIEQPYTHMAGFQDERQTIIAASKCLGHLRLANAIEDIIAYAYQQENE